MKLCSIIVNGNVSVLNFIFQYSCIVYKSFYDLYVMVLIVKPYFIKQATKQYALLGKQANLYFIS